MPAPPLSTSAKIILTCLLVTSGTLGVSVPGMKSGTVFTGKIPKVIDVDFVRELCVPIEKLSETLKKKAVTGSRVAYCYQQSAKLAQQLKK